MSNVMNEQIRHLQQRLTKAERERDAALAALRPFADMYRTYHQRGLPLPHIDAEHFALAAELVPEEPAQEKAGDAPTRMGQGEIG